MTTKLSLLYSYFSPIKLNLLKSIEEVKEFKSKLPPHFFMTKKRGGGVFILVVK